MLIKVVKMKAFILIYDNLFLPVYLGICLYQNGPLNKCRDYLCMDQDLCLPTGLKERKQEIKKAKNKESKKERKKNV